MELEWAHEISRKAWTERVKIKRHEENSSSHEYSDEYQSPVSYHWPEWIMEWLHKSRIYMRRLRKYTQLKEM